MLAHQVPRRRWGLLASGLVAMFVALATLAPTGAEAAPFSLKVSSSDAVVTSSCDFTVTRFNENNTGPSTVTARITIKGAEIKPSFFSPRKVATLQVSCYVEGLNDPTNYVLLSKTNNASTVYRSKYVELRSDTGFRACVSASYLLRNGTLGGTQTVCNPA